MDANTGNDQLIILYQDDYLIAIVKPAGILVHRSQLDVHDQKNILQQLRRQTGRFLFPVHRLDKPTSGVLLFALDSSSARIVSQQFEHHTIKKHYLAVVRGYTDSAGTIDYPIRDKDAKTKHRNEAVTSYTRLATIELPYRIDRYPTTRYSLLNVTPVTGRRHQIRLHMKHIKHPLIGDSSYGKTTHNRFFTKQFSSSRLLLHAHKLVLLHPHSGCEIEICSAIEDHPAIDNGQFQRVLADKLWLRDNQYITP